MENSVDYLNLSEYRKFIETYLIMDDLVLHLSLIEYFSKRDHSGSIIFSYSPLISMIVWESYQYLQKNNSQIANELKLSFDKQIQYSRHRVKQYTQPEEYVKKIKWASSYHHELFIGKHRGILAPLKKFLQCDLGLYTINGKFYSSSILALLNLGFDETTFPSIENFENNQTKNTFFDFGKSIGEYFGSIINMLDLKDIRYEFDENVLKGYKFDSIDKKSEKFFSSIFNNKPCITINWILFTLYLSLSFTENILLPILPVNSIASLKIKFMTLYHLVDSLKTFQSIYRPQKILTPFSENKLASIFDDKELNSLVKKRKFRNVLVHYELDETFLETFANVNDISGFIEYYFKDESISSLTKVLNQKLLYVYNLMYDWMNHAPNK